MGAIVHAPDGKSRLRKGWKCGLIDIRSEPGLDQRCQTKVSAVRDALARLPKKRFDSVRVAQSIRIPGLRCRRSCLIDQFLANIWFREISGGIDDLAGPDPLLIPTESLHQNQMAHQFGVFGSYECGRVYVGTGWAQDVWTCPERDQQFRKCIRKRVDLKIKFGLGVEKPKPGGSIATTRVHFASLSNNGS